MCFYIGDTQEQTKDGMLKSVNCFLEIYSVFYLEKSMHCVYIGPEGKVKKIK